MKPEMRERLYRTMLGAILSSDLNVGDLRKVAKEMKGNPKVWYDFGQILEALSDNFSASPINSRGNVVKSKYVDEFDSERIESQSALVDEMYDFLKRKKITRNEVLSVIEKINPNLISDLPLNAPVREIIRNFSVHSSRDQLVNFKNYFGSKYVEDDYLSGMRRRPSASGE
jgi:hypothetical protein